MRNTHFRTSNMARNTEKLGKWECTFLYQQYGTEKLGKWECTVEDLEYGEKPEIHGKRETHTVGHETYRETVKNVKNEKCTLQDLEYAKK